MGRRLGSMVAVVGCAVATTSCSGNTSTLTPQSDTARHVTGLWWGMFAVSVAVVLGVCSLLLYGLFHRRSDAEVEPPTTSPGREGMAWVIGGGIVFPVVVLIVTFLFTLGTMSAQADFDRGGDVTVEIVGHQWWWEVRYPDLGITTANEVHIPIGTPVRIQTTSVDVIHSVWLPTFGRKIDSIPGRVNAITIEADEAGTFRGECAEYCGLQHAHMSFVLVAQSPTDFDAWAERQQAVPPAVPTDPQLERGQEVFLSSACVSCHTISGTNASGRLGPDLTHVASRATLGAGTIPNTRGNLQGWILDPQSIKPGNEMPAPHLTADEVNDLVAYLESLT